MSQAGHPLCFQTLRNTFFRVLNTYLVLFAASCDELEQWTPSNLYSFPAVWSDGSERREITFKNTGPTQLKSGRKRTASADD